MILAKESKNTVKRRLQICNKVKVMEMIPFQCKHLQLKFYVKVIKSLNHHYTDLIDF